MNAKYDVLEQRYNELEIANTELLVMANSKRTTIPTATVTVTPDTTTTTTPTPTGPSASAAEYATLKAKYDGLQTQYIELLSMHRSKQSELHDLHMRHS